MVAPYVHRMASVLSRSRTQEVSPPEGAPQTSILTGSIVSRAATARSRKPWPARPRSNQSDLGGSGNSPATIRRRKNVGHLAAAYDAPRLEAAGHRRPRITV